MLMPTAATTQIIAAEVRPVTRPRDWMIAPAPRKPIPVTICAARRPGSAGRPVAITMATCVDSHMNSIEPRQMRMLVRKPGGLFFISRSTPMRPPQTIARSAFGRKSRASGSIEPQDSSTLLTLDRSPRSRRYNYILFQGDAMNGALRDKVAPFTLLLLAAGALAGAAAYRVGHAGRREHLLAQSDPHLRVLAFHARPVLPRFLRPGAPRHGGAARAARDEPRIGRDRGRGRHDPD